MKRNGSGRHYVHGTDYSYKSGKCRCDLCKAAHSAKQREDRERWKAEGCPSWQHGTESGYVHYFCRCDKCSAAGSAARKERYERSKGVVA